MEMKRTANGISKASMRNTEEQKEQFKVKINVYARLAAMLIEKGIQIEELKTKLIEKDETVTKIFDLLKDTVDEILEIRPGALQYMKTCWYCGFNIRWDDTMSDYAYIEFRDSTDRIKQNLLLSQIDGNKYCEDLLNLIRGDFIQKKAMEDDKITKMNDLLELINLKNGKKK